MLLWGIKEALFIAVLEQLAVGHLSEHALLALRDRPMKNLSILEGALTLWAQETIKHILHPTYIGLMRLLIAELPRFPQLVSQFAEASPNKGGVSQGDSGVCAPERCDRGRRS